MSDPTGQTRRKAAWKHLKGHSSLYTILCTLSVLVGIYADYQSSISEVRDEAIAETIEVESKAREVDQARVEVDTNLYQNQRLMFGQALVFESRISTLELRIEDLEKENESLVTRLLGLESKDRPSVSKSGSDSASARKKRRPPVPDGPEGPPAQGAGAGKFLEQTIAPVL